MRTAFTVQTDIDREALGEKDKNDDIQFSRSKVCIKFSIPGVGLRPSSLWNIARSTESTMEMTVKVREIHFEPFQNDNVYSADEDIWFHKSGNCKGENPTENWLFQAQRTGETPQGGYKSDRVWISAHRVEMKIPQSFVRTTIIRICIFGNLYGPSRM